jgi:predicted AAA+ superfamily ATPase
LKDQQKKNTPCVYINCEEYFSNKFSNLKEFCTWIQTEFDFDVYKKGVLMLDEIQVWDDPDRLLKSYHDNTDIKATIIAT